MVYLEFGYKNDSLIMIENVASDLPSDFETNLENNFKWITQRRGYKDTESMTSTVDFDGLFNKTDKMAYWPQSPPLVFLHEYWAATDKAARKLTNYPWRIIPDTDPPVKRYLGIFVGSFDMIFTDQTVTYNPGQRWSNDGPP